MDLNIKIKNIFLLAIFFMLPNFVLAVYPVVGIVKLHNGTIRRKLLSVNFLLFFVVLFFSFYLVSPAYGAPSVSGISGTVLHNDTVTINGSGFGNRTNYNAGIGNFLNAAWSDFEEGELNSGNLEVDSDYQPTNWSLSGTGERLGSSYHAKQEFVSQRLGSLSYYQEIQANEWYTSFWFKTTQSDIVGKFWRIYGDNPANNIYISTGGGNAMIRGFSECTACFPEPIVQWESPDSFTINQWHRVEILMQRNPDEFMVYLDGREQWNRISSINNQYVRPDFNGQGHTINIGSMMENLGSWNFDDIYIDYTYARVEICNASTKTTSNHCEIQIPETSWVDNQLQIKINQGSFADNSSAYLYVLDSAGAANADGFPITFGSGGSSDTTAPNAPTNLSVL